MVVARHVGGTTGSGSPEATILAAGATPVRVRFKPPALALDVGAIVAALGPRTRAVIINPPHNPTGRIY